MTDKQPDALRLAGLLELAPEDGVEPQTTEDAAAELRRLHTENTTLQQGYAAARLEIESLRGRSVAPDPRPVVEMCAKALAEELAAWDIDPPLHHVKEAHDACELWLAAIDADRAMRAAQPAGAQAAPAAGAVTGSGEVVAHRVVRKSLSGDEWASDARDWSDGPPSRALVDSIRADKGRWRIDVAYAAPATQPAPQQAAPAVPTQEFERWVAAYSTLPVTRDERGYTDMTTEMLWHAWQAATKTKAPVGASDGVIDASARPGLAGVDYTCAHDFAVQPSSGIKLCQKCGLSETAAGKAAPQQEPSHTAVQLAELVLSDCGHSSNYTPLLDRVAARIDSHVERRLDELRGCLESKPAPQQEAPAMPSGWVSCTIEFDGSGPEEVAYGPKIMMDRLAKWLGKHFERTIAEKAAPQPLPASQGDALDAARLDWLLLHISGAEFRRIGVHYSGNARRADVDAARAAQESKSHDN